MGLRLSWAGSATQRGDVAGPVLARPLVVGYLRVWPTDPPGHADALTAQLRAFADRSGLVLADVYTEQPDVSSREGAAFDALVEALRRPHIHAVVIPSPEHFSRFGGMYRAMRTVIGAETSADVLVVSNGPGNAR